MLQAEGDARAQAEPIGAERGARNSSAAFDLGTVLLCWGLVEVVF